MEKMNDLRDLLKHELQDLYSAEEQIIKALPAMIDKAKNSELKRALQGHLRITEQHKTRLEQMQQRIDAGQRTAETSENKGLFARLMARRQMCKGMHGILDEGQKILAEDMNPEVMDAAIIACAQKIEHYEICGYGTAKAWARELNLTEVESLLDLTLTEEYQADDRMTQLAVGRLNREAESAGGSRSRTAAAGQSGSTARSDGGRATTRERARIDEPEMEYASRSRTTGTGNRSQEAAGTTGGRTSSAASRTSSPKSTASGRGNVSSRSTSSGSTTGASRTSKPVSKPTGRTTSPARSKGSSGRGNNTRNR
jgi:ferritin-like metal-binding protein YciE